MKIVFAGTPAFGLPSLEALFQSEHQLQAIYTQPDKPAGRGRQLQASPIKTWALSQGIPVYQPANFKMMEDCEALSTLEPDLMIVIAYGLLLPQRVLEIPRFGCINVHASLLPRWRGASPIQQAILHGDQYSGITIMQMDSGLDTGAILKTRPYLLNAKETAGSLHDQLASLAVEPLLDVLNDLSQGHLKSEDQDSSAASYAAKINKTDAAIQWEEAAQSISRQVRAFNPWPMAYSFLGEERLRIHEVEAMENSLVAELPGRIIQLDASGLLVSAGPEGKDRLKITKIQFPGGQVREIASFLHQNPCPFELNQCFTSIALHEIKKE